MSTPVILVPVDGSEYATRAAAYALKMEVLMGARLLLLYCYRPFPLRLGEPHFQNSIEKIMVQANTLLDSFRSMLTEKGVDIADLIMEGPPGEKICEVARNESCEMGIMGSRWRSDLKGLLLGRVALRVLQQASCSWFADFFLKAVGVRWY